jgi:CRP/FNR family cyclic AMP-dependent transcriptional regulator
MALPRILRSLPLEDAHAIAPGAARRPLGTPDAIREGRPSEAIPPPAHLGPGRAYERGRTLLAQGADRQEVFVVKRGLLREAAVSLDGRWFVHGLLGPGDVFGSLTRSGPAPASVRTLRPSEVITIPRLMMDELIHHHPDAAWWLLTRIERRLLRAQTTTEELAWHEVPGRVRRRLLVLAQQHGRRTSDGIRIDVPLTQEDLAAMVGAARETVNRTIVSLISSGFVRVEHRRYILRDALLDCALDDGEWTP